MSGLAGRVVDAFGLEVVSGEGRVEVVVLAEPFAFGLLHEVDVVDYREEHVFDVVAAERRSLVVLHLLLLHQITEFLRVELPALAICYFPRSHLLPQMAITVRSPLLSRNRSIQECKFSKV